MADAFRRCFAELGEVGASVAITHEGDTVVDLWGGTTTPDGDPWQSDTLVTVFSSTKGGVALAAHLLADRGELDLDAPVAEIWPEFAHGAKAELTNSDMLAHTTGVAALREELPAGACTDWDLMCERIAAEEPWWEPGTRNGYHMLTFGWTAGELVRRVSGRSLGEFFRDEIAGPAGADFHIGLPEDQHHRVAPVLEHRRKKGDPLSAFTLALLNDNEGMQAMGWLNQGGFNPNSPACWSAEIGGAGGCANGRGLALAYRAAALGELVGDDQLVRMATAVSATKTDAMLLLPTRFSEGFMLSMDNTRRPHGDRDSVVIGRAAFGHVGAGGSIGMADPEHGLSIGYAMNQMGPGLLLNERGQSLVDAAYHCAGATSREGGAWR